MIYVILAIIIYLPICIHMRDNPIVVRNQKFPAIAGRAWVPGIIWVCTVDSQGRARPWYQQETILRHERIHNQHYWELGGPTGIALYGVLHLFYGYDANPFERAAYAFDDRAYSWVRYLRA